VAVQEASFVISLIKIALLVNILHQRATVQVQLAPCTNAHSVNEA
jgi:hypothetical protein